MRNTRLLIAVVLALANASGAMALIRDADETLLYDARILLDNESLIELLDGKRVDVRDRGRIGELVVQLRSKDFAERQAAAAALCALGEIAVPALTKALLAEDAETRAAGSRCLAQVKRSYVPGATLTAIRVLTNRRAAGAAGALLRHLPSAIDYEVEEEICFGLDHLATEAADPAVPWLDERARTAVMLDLSAALGDINPMRRAIAACILGRLGDRRHKETVRKLLTDPVPVVRLRAAQGLLAAGDFGGLPALVELLADAPLEVALQSEELLRCVAGVAAPRSGVGDEFRRAEVVMTWRRLLPTLRNADPSKASRRPAVSRLLLVYDASRKLSWLCGGDGRERWRAPVKPDHAPADFQRGDYRSAWNDGPAWRTHHPYWRWPACWCLSEQIAPHRFRGTRGGYAHESKYLAGGDRILEVDGWDRMTWFAFVEGECHRVEECFTLLRLGFRAEPISAAERLAYRLGCLRSRHAELRRQPVDWLGFKLANLADRIAAFFPAPIIARAADNLRESIKPRPRSILGMWLAAHSADDAVRQQSHRDIATHDYEADAVAPLLIRALDDPDVKVRYDAFNRLRGCRGVPELPTALLRKMADPLLRPVVGYNLINIGPALAPHLRTILKLGAGDDEVMPHLVGAVHSIGPLDPGTIPDLQRLLKLPVSSQKASSCIASYAGHVRIELAPLLQALRDHADVGYEGWRENRRLAVLQALYLVGLHQNDAVAAIGDLLRDEQRETDVRIRAARALAGYGRRGAFAIPELRKLASRRDSLGKAASDILKR